MQQVTLPRIVIAGTHSGCGKTTIASGLMAALTEHGLRVQPFKTGPDFIDPTHHSVTCGRVSRNLDPFMMAEAGVLRTFASASGDADVAVIEGAMGLFDGIDGTDFASTAHVARILRAPVILVVDAYATSRSVHAVVRGFRDFDPHIRIARHHLQPDCDGKTSGYDCSRGICTCTRLDTSPAGIGSGEPSPWPRYGARVRRDENVWSHCPGIL